MKTGAELVHLVEHHHGIARAGLADRLDDVAGQGADIGAAVTADFRLVMHAAEAQPHEFAPGGARDALAERGLADARRPDEAKDRALALRIELAHRKIFENAPLHLLEPVMILVEDAARLGNIDALRARASTRADRSANRDSRESSRIRRPLPACARAVSVPSGPAPAPPRHFGLSRSLRELGDLGRFVVAFAQLLLNLAKLFAKDVLALLRGQRLLRLVADPLRESEHLETARQKLKHFVEAFLHVDRLEDILFFVGGRVHDAGHEIREPETPKSKLSIAENFAEARSAGAARASLARSRKRRSRASISGVMTSEAPISSTRAARNG